MGISAGPYIIRDSSLILDIDAADRNSYTGSGDNIWRDLSANSNTGSLTATGSGIPPFYSTEVGGSIVFNGTNSTIDCGSSSIYNITDNLTVNVWYKSTDLFNKRNGWSGLFGKRNGASANYGVNFISSSTANSNTFQWYCGNGTNFCVASASLTTFFPGNEWVNFCGTMELSASRMNMIIYKNGQLINSTLNSTILSTNSPNGLSVGRTNDTGTGGVAEFLSGSIAIFQMYNRVLTINEIKQNFDAQRRRFGL